MKIGVFILALLIILSSCSSPERKAKKAIKEKLKVTLHDFKSYEPVEFGTLDSLFSDVTSSSEYEVLKSKHEAWIRQVEKENKADQDEIQKAIYDGNSFHIPIINEYSLVPRCKDSAQVYAVKMQAFEDSYKPRFIGWSMTHLYRAKNLAGNYRLANESFYFDKDLIKVAGSIDMSEE
jgi:hypothetical protein